MAESKILYLCKYHKDPHYCKHTSRIEDALNFSEVADGLYVENEIRKNNWIPVSERLPEQNGVYITTCRDICEDRVHAVVFDGVRKKWGRGGVIAWQPLPEPYKKEGEEE